MSLVSVVGRRSLRVRLLLLGMYLLLGVGSITMIYPFALMVSVATMGKADYEDFNLVPAYLTSRGDLFKKYMFDAAGIQSLSTWFGKDDWFTVRDIRSSD